MFEEEFEPFVVGAEDVFVGEVVYFRLGLDVIPPVPVDGAMEGEVVFIAIASEGAWEIEGDEVELVDEEGERDGEEDALVEFLGAVGEDEIDGEMLGADVSTVVLLEMVGALLVTVSVTVSVSTSCALRCVCPALLVLLLLVAAPAARNDLLVKARMKNRFNDGFMI